MRILWVNPSFLDYRIPLYKEVYNLADKNFYLIYSENRVPERCIKGINQVIGDHAIPLKSEKVYTFGHSTEIANSRVNIPFPKGLYKQIKLVKPNIIIAEGFFQFTPWAVVYSFIHRIPLVIAYERTAHTERNCPKWRHLYRKIISKFVSGYVVNGSLTKEYLISKGIDPSTIFTGAMCADSQQIAKKVRSMEAKDFDELREGIGLKQTGGLIYLFVGRLIELKGVQYLLAAWMEHIKKYPQDHLLIVGGGPMEERFHREYDSEPSIMLIGPIDYSIIYKYYALCDVFVIPTLKDNWSLVVPEAMASGKAIASSIYNGCYPELVHVGENGVLFDPLKHETIVDALGIFHEIDLLQYGKRSIAIESNFNPQKTGMNIYFALKEVFNNYNKGNKSI